MAMMDLSEFIRNFPENGMKRMLQNTKNLRDFLRIAAALADEEDKRLITELDFKKLTLLNTTFVKPDFRHLLSDLLIYAPRRGKPSRTDLGFLAIYLLIEHQSAPARLMPLRILEYVTQAYASPERGWRDTKRLRLIWCSRSCFTREPKPGANPANFSNWSSTARRISVLSRE